MTRAPKTAAVAASVAALAIAGCGGSDESERLLPAGTAGTIRAELHDIGLRVADRSVGACDDIFEGADGGTFEGIDAALADTPENVDAGIRSALEQSIERLRQLVDAECGEIRGEEADEQDTVTEEPIPAEPEKRPTEPETTPAEPETTPTTETAPPATDQGKGGGRDGGQGRGPTGNGPPGQDGGTDGGTDDESDSGGVEAPGDD
ncbi:MAG: hypothetical protein WD993_10575 [Thermoleophilaceae bacterium]